MKDLKVKAIQAGFAKLCSQGISFIVRVVSLMCLGRLLDPMDFGLVAMVTIVSSFLEKLRDAGLSLVTVQRPTITDEEVSTLFWVNMTIGALLGFVLSASSPVLAFFYNEPRLVAVTMVLAAGFIVNAASVQHSALLQREMRFATLSGIEVVSITLSAGVGIIMAISGCKYWALVAMTLVVPVTTVIGVWLATNWVPGRPHWGPGAIAMVRVGGITSLNTLVVDIAFNIEKVLLGRFWGAESLGIYGRAYQLVKLPPDSLNLAIGGVIFAVLSRVQNDRMRFKVYFLKGYSLVVALTVLTTTGCALFADDIILVILGSQWKDATLIFRLLTPTILVLALTTPMGWLMYALGLVERSLRISLVMATLVIITCILSLPYGPPGVAGAYSIAMILWVIPHLVWSIQGTAISLRDILNAIYRPLLSAMVSAGVVLGAQSFYGELLTPFPRLVVGGSILVLFYLWMLLYVMGQKLFYLDLLGGLKWSTVNGELKSDVGV